MENVPNWSQACENISIPSEIMILETAIHQHQNLYESMCQAYTEVSCFILHSLVETTVLCYSVGYLQGMCVFKFALMFPVSKYY